MTTPAVVRDNFVYNDTFFAQVDDNKRHTRASVAELTSLLRPETSSAPPAKDQVGHWYQAQLLHYGLPPSKDKNTAKVRLLQAINASTLSIPDHVAKLEKDMKKEFTAATRKAKAAEKTPATQSKGKKRIHEEETTNTKITLTVDGVSITVDRQTAASIMSAVDGASPAAKKAKVTKGIAATVKPKQTKESPSAIKPKSSKIGVIRADNFFSDGFNDFDFNWRSRDMGSGQLRFGRGCEGIMEFGIHGVDKGTFYRLFDGIDVDFGVSSFTRDTQMDWPDWMDQWEGYVKEAYGSRKPAEEGPSQPRVRTKQTARKK
ncbi:unnamed protein product [Aureobasidium uvarum]|uniref:Uncharacterized protein n=1 Tax=Aureobasidium uvarum TaxID=2773716 RepID=A0A9N8KA51_9PEZI|nr:unnamed protein product [Aureobasidium uvarum]